MTNPTYPPGAPTWVDIGTTDVPGTVDFYTRLFGWTHQELGPNAGGYGVFRQHGKQVAGIGPATDPARGTSWATYLATENTEATTAAVQAAGGSVVLEPMQVADQGTMAVFTDPDGAYFSVWQAGRHPGSELKDEHGSLTWAELMTTDIAAATSFYTKLFPVTTRQVPIGEGTTYTLFESGGTSLAGAMQMPPEMAGTRPYWSVYFAVDDCDATADRAIELGATQMMRDDSPAGRVAILNDPQGGQFGIIKNDPNFAP